MTTLQYLSNKTGISQKRIKDVLKRSPYLYKHREIIQRKSGKKRKVSIPFLELKILQQKLLSEILMKKIKLPSYVHGGVVKRSIFTNALPHGGKKYVVCLDIKDFFPSIHFRRLKNNLEKYFDKGLLDYIVRMTTHNYCLPQGAPTSPFLSNVCFLEADDNINRLCKLNHLSYTRFFDDITISGNNANVFCNKIEQIVRQQGYKLNHGKRLIQHRSSPQMITGLVVNRKGRPYLPTSEIYTIKSAIKEVKEKGMDYFDAKENILKEVFILKGKIAFVRQVSRKEGGKLSRDFDDVIYNLGL